MAANRQSGGDDGCYREKFRNFVASAKPDPKQHFSCFRVPFDYPAHRKQFYPNQSETLKVCLLLVWRVCDQAFDRYRPMKGAKKWSRDITKIEKLHIDTRKNYLIPKMLFFSIYDKNNEVIAEKPFPNSGVTRRLWTLGRLELTLVVNTRF